MKTVLAVASLLLISAPGYAQTSTASAASCERLAASLKLPNSTVTSATVVAAGKFVPPGGGAAAAANLPAFCRVLLTIKPSSDSDIKSEVWLPMSGWNGRFLQVGNGAWGGSIQYGPLGDGLRRGYAAASTDTGHTGADASFISSGDQPNALYGNGIVPGDLNADGIDDIAIGAPNISPGGAVYVIFGAPLGGVRLASDSDVLITASGSIVLGNNVVTR